MSKQLERLVCEASKLSQEDLTCLLTRLQGLQVALWGQGTMSVDYLRNLVAVERSVMGHGFLINPDGQGGLPLQVIDWEAKETNE